MKAQLTRHEYKQAVALVALADYHQQRVFGAQFALAQLLELDENGPLRGALSAAVVNGDSADELLAALGIQVEEVLV